MDCRSDFYSLGSILHQLLTGKLLFGEYVSADVMLPEDGLEIATAHRSRIPAHPTAGQEPLLDELVLHLLAKLPEMRYHTGIPSIRYH